MPDSATDTTPQIDADSLAQRIAKALRLGKSDPDLDDPDTNAELATVKGLRARLSEVSSQRRKLAEEVEAIRGEVDGYRAKTVAEVEAAKQAAAKQVADLRKQFDTDLEARMATARGMADEDLALSDLGIRDPLGRKTLRMVHESLPEAERGEGPVQWWKTVTEAHAAHVADPKTAKAPTVPTPLIGFLGAPQPPAKPLGRAAPDTETNVVRGRDPGAVTAADIAKMTPAELAAFRASDTYKALVMQRRG